jgi:hypothetical protein
MFICRTEMFMLDIAHGYTEVMAVGILESQKRQEIHKTLPMLTGLL